MLTFTGCVSLVLPSAFSMSACSARTLKFAELLPRRQDSEPFVLDADDATELRDDAAAAGGHGIKRPDVDNQDENGDGDDAVADVLREEVSGHVRPVVVRHALKYRFHCVRSFFLNLPLEWRAILARARQLPPAQPCASQSVIPSHSIRRQHGTCVCEIRRRALLERLRS